MPEVIIIDEMGTELEAIAARTIAERGVQLIATAHGNTLSNLIMNPTLSDLVGGVQTVTLGDDEARRRGTQKSVQEREAPPTFEVLVEIQGWDRVAFHRDVAATVDALLRGYPVVPEVRWVDQQGKLQVERGEAVTLGGPKQGQRFSVGPIPPRRPRGRHPAPEPLEEALLGVAAAPALQAKSQRLFPFGVSRDRLLQTLRYFGIGVELASSAQDADMVLTTKSNFRRKPGPLRAAEASGKPIYVLRKNTQPQLEHFLKSLSAGWGGDRGGELEVALKEAEDAVSDVMAGETSVELSPQSAYIRRLQHVLAQRYNLASASTGSDPQRRVIIYRP